MKFRSILTAFIVLTEAKKEPKFAPYIDVTRLGEFRLTELKQEFGLKSVSLAFALGGRGGCNPMWGAQLPINNSPIINQIKAFKAAGGDVIVSTGGAVGPYLETSCRSAEELVNAYKRVLSATGSTHLDVDIESSIPLDIMNQALATLQKQMPSLTVSFTLEVQSDDYGITDILGVSVLKNAVKHGVNVDIVNPMTMEFSSSRESWGDAVIAAAEATLKQVKGVWPHKSEKELYSMLGVTPMIGKNFNGKVFDTKHAKQLVDWAKSKQIGHLAFWSLNRDHGCAGKAVGPDCSSIAQADHEFTKIFVTFH